MDGGKETSNCLYTNGLSLRVSKWGGRCFALSSLLVFVCFGGGGDLGRRSDPSTGDKLEAFIQKDDRK